MKKRKGGLVLAAVLLAILPAAAKEFTYPDLNCRCVVPPSWFFHEMDGFTLWVNNFWRNKLFFIRASVGDFSDGQGDVVFHSMETTLVSHGNTITARRYRKINGIEFREVKMFRDEGNRTVYEDNYFTVVDSGWYCIGLSEVGADPDDDNELQGMLNSFTFLHDPGGEAARQETAPREPAPQEVPPPAPSSSDSNAGGFD